MEKMVDTDEFVGVLKGMTREQVRIAILQYAGSLCRNTAKCDTEAKMKAKEDIENE